MRGTLQSVRFDNVFVVGDAAALRKPLSKQAYYAIQIGEHAAGNVERLSRGQRLDAFSPAAKPSLVSFGDLDTYMIADGYAVAGTALAAAKEAVYQLTMALLDPPAAGESGQSFVQRAATGVRRLALPAVMSLDRLVRLPKVRIIC